MCQSPLTKLTLRLLVLAGLCAGSAAGQLGHQKTRWPSEAPVKEGVVVAQGQHFVVHLQFENELAGKRAIDAVDQAWGKTMHFLGALDHRYRALLEIHLYASKERYTRVDSWLTGGNFKFNESFSHWNSLSAHVVMAPPLQEPSAGRFGLTSQTLEVLVHEAAHLASYTVLPTYRYHPTWFSEGLAMHVERATMRGLGLLQDPAEHPRYATQQLVAKRLLDEKRVPRVSDILVDELGDLSFHERYALWNDFMRVLTRDGDPRFAASLKELGSMRGGPEMRARMSAVIIDIYGAQYLERELARELADAPANWDESARSLETIGEEWEQVAFASVDASAWRLAPMPTGSYSMHGALELLGKEASMQLLLDRQDSGYLSVDFRSDRVALLANSDKGQSTLASVDIPKHELGSEIAFYLSVDKGALALNIDGAEVFSLALSGRSFQGPWGLGVGRGSAGLWHGLRVE